MDGTLTALRKNRLQTRPTDEELSRFVTAQSRHVRVWFARFTVAAASMVGVGVFGVLTLIDWRMGSTLVASAMAASTVTIVLVMGCVGRLRSLQYPVEARRTWLEINGPAPDPVWVDDLLAIPAEVTFEPEEPTLSWRLLPELAQLISTQPNPQEPPPDSPVEGHLDLGMPRTGQWTPDPDGGLGITLARVVGEGLFAALAIESPEGDAIVLELDARWLESDAAYEALPSVDRRGIALWDRDLRALLSALRPLLETTGAPFPTGLLNGPRDEKPPTQ